MKTLSQIEQTENAKQKLIEFLNTQNLVGFVFVCVFENSNDKDDPVGSRGIMVHNRGDKFKLLGALEEVKYQILTQYTEN